MFVKTEGRRRRQFVLCRNQGEGGWRNIMGLWRQHSRVEEVGGGRAGLLLFLKLISEEQVREEIRTKKSSFLSGIVQINLKLNNFFLQMSSLTPPGGNGQ